MVVRPFLKTLKNTHAMSIQQIGLSGSPDYVLCANGVFVALELKAPKGRVSPLQNFNLQRVKECGGIAIVASPVNWESVKTFLQKLDEDTKDD